MGRSEDAILVPQPWSNECVQSLSPSLDQHAAQSGLKQGIQNGSGIRVFQSDLLGCRMQWAGSTLAGNANKLPFDSVHHAQLVQPQAALRIDQDHYGRPAVYGACIQQGVVHHCSLAPNENGFFLCSPQMAQGLAFRTADRDRTHLTGSPFSIHESVSAFGPFQHNIWAFLSVY